MSTLATVRRHPLLTAAFGLALAVTLFFAVRVVLFTIFWSDPAHRDQPIDGWMSPGFVSHSWHVPPEVIGQALELPPPDDRHLSLDEIAEQRGVPVASLIDSLDAAIAEFRAAHP